VRVDTEDGHARLVVTDDGSGFDGDVEEGHFGLRVLADLAQEAEGTMKLDTHPDSGTTICIEAPL
jgi:two-component system, NarL family, sensor kinase